MTLFEGAVLGVVQGLTEFLPVSSSAHLILARAVFGWDAGELNLPFDVACHLGTLVAVAAFFGRDLAGLVTATDGQPVRDYTLIDSPAPKRDESIEEREERLYGSGAQRLTIHDAAGAFLIRRLTPGAYELSVTTAFGTAKALSRVSKLRSPRGEPIL